MLSDLKNGVVGNALGQVGDIGKKIGIEVVKAGKDIAKTAPKQITGKQETLEKEKSEVKVGSKPPSNDKDAQDLIKALYGPSEKGTSPEKNSASINNPAQQVATKIASENPEKTPEEIQKMAALRQQLHQQNYYDPIFNPERKQAEEQAEEEQEKKQEEQEELWKKQEEERKKKEEEEALQRQKRPTAEKRPGAG